VFVPQHLQFKDAGQLMLVLAVEGELCTYDVLRASRVALVAQSVANRSFAGTSL